MITAAAALLLVPFPLPETLWACLTGEFYSASGAIVCVSGSRAGSPRSSRSHKSQGLSRPIGRIGSCLSGG